jgi:hypothetical protein
MNRRKELYSFVPQEISRHFIESNRQQDQSNETTTTTTTTARIHLNQEIQSHSTTDEEDQETLYEYDYEYDDDDDDDDDEDYEYYNGDDSTLCDSSNQNSDSNSSIHENGSDMDVSQPQKWPFMRGLFSKLRLHSNNQQSSSLIPQQQHHHQEFGNTSPYLSSYGTLINKCIGEGVSATVQLTQRDDALFAVKIFRKRKRNEMLTGYMKALASEFCIASALNHQNIIKTLDFVRMDNDHERYCIVMEFVSVAYYFHI